MGRTTEIFENPSVKTLKWKNEKHEKNPKTKQLEKVRSTGWYYWDKSANNGDGAEFMVDMPLTFTWLETATSFTGYNEAAKNGIYSNEVLDTKTQPMTVRIGKDVIAEGLYADIKDAVTAKGGKFCLAVYALMDGEIVRFLMTGSSLSWITFNNRIKNNTHQVVCYDTKSVKKGTNEYEEPVFKYLPMSDEDKEAADDIYKNTIEPFFNYMIKETSKEPEPIVQEDYE